jgi:hypothetical protein
VAHDGKIALRDNKQSNSGTSINNISANGQRVLAMKETIRVIHYSDIDSYLARLLQAKTIAAEDLVCACCGIVISAINFGGVTRLADKLVFSCTNEACLVGLTITNIGS